MKLNDKLWVLRKQAGLSQEALAERIGVSRQAISKWETGEASPEITKLPLLARTFGVTADWLLDDSAEPEDDHPDEPAPDAEPEPAASPRAERPVNAYPDWIDHLPGFLGRMIKRYGWIIGVRMAISGALFTAMGCVARAMFSSMTQMAADGFSGMFPASANAGLTVYDSAGNIIDPASIGLTDSALSAMGIPGGSTYSPFGGISMTITENNPADILCTFIIVLGLMLLIGGALLAWYLKKWGQQQG